MGSSATVAGLLVQFDRDRSARSALFNTSSATTIRLVWFDAGVMTILDTKSVNTTAYGGMFSSQSKIRIHLRHFDPTPADRVDVYYNGMVIASLDASGFGGVWTRRVGLTFNGRNTVAALPCRSSGGRFIRPVTSTTVASVPNTGLPDVVVFADSEVRIGTLGREALMSKATLQTAGSPGPPAGGVAGLLGGSVSAVAKIITQNDAALTLQTRTRILAVDGAAVGADNQVIIDPVDKMVANWDLTSNTQVYGCRLICLFGDRVVLAGLDANPSLIFASASVKNPGGVEPHLNFNASDTTLPASQRPWVSTDPNIGSPADGVVALIPLSQRRLLVGCTKSFYYFTDDPGYGGQCISLSSATGIMGAHAYCFDDAGNLYFLGPGGLMTMPAGGLAFQNVSGSKLPELLERIDVDAVTVSMAWDAGKSMVRIFLTPRDPAIVGTHVALDTRRNALWPAQYPVGFGPAQALEISGRAYEDRRYLLLCQDGFVRRPRENAFDDDGTIIPARITYPPAQMGEGERGVLADTLAVTLSPTSGAVEYQLRVADSAAQVQARSLSDTPDVSGTLASGSGGRQRAVGIRLAGGAIEPTIRSDGRTGSWSLEMIVLTAVAKGRRRV